MSLLLALLYPLAIQYKRWPLLYPLAAFTALVDVVANYTELSLVLWEFPRKGEHTFSQRAARLIHYDDWRGAVVRRIAVYVNYFDDNHIG